VFVCSFSSWTHLEFMDSIISQQLFGSCSSFSRSLKSVLFTSQKVLAEVHEQMHGQASSKRDLLIPLGASCCSFIVNFILALLNTYAGAPDGFFLMIAFYGVLQVYTAAYFWNQRLAVFKEQVGTSVSRVMDAYSIWFTNRTTTLLLAVIVVNLSFLVLLQPVALMVLALGPCNKSQNCSALLVLFLIGIIFISVNSILLVSTLPGITKANWTKQNEAKLRKSGVEPQAIQVQLVFNATGKSMGSTGKIVLDDINTEVLSVTSASGGDNASPRETTL
jgi:hypothetical protein